MKVSATMITVGLSALALTGCAGIVDHRADRREAEAEAQYPPEGRIITLEDGRRVHAVTKGQGPDLILLHGASGNTRDFTFAFMDRLTDRYRVTAFDRPGLGWTDRAAPSLAGPFDKRAESPLQQAAMLQEAADAIGIADPVVLGHSYGGSVALAWGLLRPGETSALVVLAGASNPWPGGLGPYYTFTASSLGGAVVVPLITAFAPLNRAEDAVESIFAPQPVPEGYVDYVGAGLTLRRETLRANARQVNSLRPHVAEMSENYDRLPMPVEIVHGTADTIVPLAIHSEPLSRQIPEANLTRLDGVGHMPHHSAPEAVVDAIDRAASRAGLR